MKHRIIYSATAFLLIIGCITAAGCTGPRTIPDEKLSNIFSDIYMVNAYANQAPMIDYDSVNIYLPVLQKYGYDTQDFIHTLAGFSKRKSAKLSAIVDNAIEQLDKSGAILKRRVATLDFIDSVAYAMTKTTLYQDSLIKIRGKADNPKLKLKLPASEGRYSITYYYRQDSVDRNYLTNRHSVKDSLGHSISSSAVMLRTADRTYYSTSLNSPAGADTLEITFGNYPSDPKRMHLTIDSLVIEHYPTREEALEKLLRSYINYTDYSKYEQDL